MDELEALLEKILLASRQLWLGQTQHPRTLKDNIGRNFYVIKGGERFARDNRADMSYSEKWYSQASGALQLSEQCRIVLRTFHEPSTV